MTATFEKKSISHNFGNFQHSSIKALDLRKLFLSHLHHCPKTKFSMKDFFSKRDQIRRKLRIWSHLLKKSLMKNFIFCAVHILLSFSS